jgi:hypothetical protein
VWETLLEWCAGLFGATVRDRHAELSAFCIGLFVIGYTLSLRWGFAGWAIPALLLAFAANAGRDVTRARDAAWRAASLPLEDPRQAPARDREAQLIPRTARALHRLATAVDDVRRGRYTAANDALIFITPTLLRPHEVRLLDAARAMISLGLGDTRTAAQLAVAALPTGSEEIDACLGRVVIADAWNKPARLRVIEADWDGKGIAPDQDGALARLHRLTRLRIDARLLDDVGAAEARALSSEARAVGDEDFAADLEARARESAYR